MCFLTTVLMAMVCLHVVSSDDLVHLSCHSDAECAKYALEHVSTTSTCINGACLCISKDKLEVPCKPSGGLVKYNTIGGPCPCSMSHAFCNMTLQQCFCNKDYVPSIDRRNCIKDLVRLDDTCEHDGQCVKNDYFSECSPQTKTCVCHQTHTVVDGHCFSVIGLGGSCNTNDQCNIEVENSFCWNNQCVCNKGYVAGNNNKVCLKGSDYGEACNTTSQCRHKLGVGSICNHFEKCVCDSQHKNYTIAGEMKCMKTKAYGDSCLEHNDCFEYDLTGLEQKMECYVGQCMCRRGYAEYDFQCININGADQISLSKITLLAATALWLSWSFTTVH